MKKILFSMALAAGIGACGDDEAKKTKVGTKLRSAGSVEMSLLLNAGEGNTSLLDDQLATSAVDLDYFKIPIHTIALVKDLGAVGGFSGTSPNFYSCDKASDESGCLVDITDDSLDTLLSGSASVEIETNGDTYNGVSVQHCQDYEIGDQYNAIVKGTVTLGDTKYYTTSNGLSETGPAEDTEIPMDCQGSDSYLLEPITVGQETTVNIVLYAEPNGVVFATNNATLANSNCVENGDDIAICSNNVNVFGTVDSERPDVERYLLATSDNYSAVIVTLLPNTAGGIFGVSMSEFFRNASEAKLLATPTMTLSGFTENDNGSYDLKYGGEDKTFELIEGFKREAHSGAFVETESLVDSAVTYTATEL